MNLDRVGPGERIPGEFNVIVEIPLRGEPVKYEIDKLTGAMVVDRFLNTAMHYPCNYGNVPRTLSEDGDPLDVLVACDVPLIPGAVVACRPVGVLAMTDEGGADAKILAVPADRLSGLDRHVGSPRDMARPCSIRSPVSSRTTRTWSRASGSASTAGWRHPRPAIWSSAPARATTTRR